MEIAALNDTEEGIRYFRLHNNNGMEVDVLNLGGVIAAIRTPDRDGRLDDVALGFRNLRDYKKKGPYFGAIVGRSGNRTKGKDFWLNGVRYELEANNGPNHLHGGLKGFDKALWKVDSHTENSITLSHLSPDGDEGYPGNLNVRVTYTLNDDNELRIKYWAMSDKDTPVNLTNHTYFNLRGEGNGTIENHIMDINSSRYTPVDSTMIPTGIESVEGTPFDFRKPRRIGDSLQFTANPQIHIGRGLDHNFVLDEATGLHRVAHVEEPETGRILDVSSTEPGVQLYTANYVGDDKIESKRGGTLYPQHAGFCLETQHFPDSLHHPEFPSIIQQAGKAYESETVYRFSVQKAASMAR